MLTSLPWLTHQEQQLFGLAQSRQLHHALLFSGPVGIGKHILAKQLAHMLLCLNPASDGACGQCKSCLLVKAGHHPDLLELQSQSSIGVEQVRDIAGLLHNAPQQGGARVILLPQAHRLTESAANALLKSLEEPSANCYFVLQTAYPAQLMPTILSRCQHWDIPAQYGTLAQQFLASHSARHVPEFLLDLVGGAPLKALEAIESGLADQLQSDLTLLRQYLQGEGTVQQVALQLEKSTELSALLFYVAREQHAIQYKVLQLLMRWNRDLQQIAGQNLHLSLVCLLLEWQQLLR